MPKELTPEYLELKAFFQYYCDRFINFNEAAPELKPIAVLEAMEGRSPSNALKGVRMAVNDCIEMSMDWDFEKVQALDKELRERGVLTLSQIRHRYLKKYAAILKHGKIRNDEEYFLVRGIVSDMGLTLKNEERSALEEIVIAYESQ